MKFELETARVILREILRPLAGYCLRSGITLRFLVDELKGVLVEEARKELERSGDDVSASRIAVMSGLHRGDVTARLEGLESSTPEQDVMRRVIGLWRGAGRYTLSSGEPKPLTFRGSSSEFMKLVSEVSRELSPYTILRELERAALVTYLDDRVVLQAFEYVPKKSIDRSYGLLSGDMNDMLLAVEQNVFGKEKVPHLHLKTEFDNIPPEQLPEIKRWVMDEGAAFHERARKYLGKRDLDVTPDSSKKEGGARVAVGTFSYAEVPQIRKRVEIRKRGRRKNDD